MNSEAREYLRRHIQVQLERSPDIEVKDMKKWLLSNQQTFDLSQVEYITLHSFVTRNMAKFKELGTMDRQEGSGRPRTARSKKNVLKIKRLALNKHRRGSRNVAAMVGVSKDTVNRALKEAGAKYFHRRKVQAMKPEHEVKRVEFARWALDTYGRVVNGNTVWGRLVNTDFSAMVKKNGTLNTKCDGVWSRSIAEAGDMLDYPQEKYEDSFMIWGGVSWKGLIPANAPIFVTDLKEEWRALGNPPTKGVTGDMYAHMITSYVVPEVERVYGRRAIWQDDPATIHRSKAALLACSAFPARIPHENQAPKMADIWPIENVWSIVKDRVKAREPKNKEQLKNTIKRVWKEIDSDKNLCKKLISSIPDRLGAVIDVGVKQIRRSDYRQNEE